MAVEHVKLRFFGAHPLMLLKIFPYMMQNLCKSEAAHIAKAVNYKGAVCYNMKNVNRSDLYDKTKTIFVTKNYFVTKLDPRALCLWDPTKADGENRLGLWSGLVVGNK